MPNTICFSGPPSGPFGSCRVWFLISRQQENGGQSKRMRYHARMDSDRFFLFYQDNVLNGAADPDKVDWLTPGPSMTPGSDPPPRRRLSELTRILFRLLTRKYRMVIITAGSVQRRAPDSAGKRLLRGLWPAVLHNSLLCRTIRQILVGRQPLIVLDRYTSPEPVPEFLDLLAPDLYLKTSLRAEDADTEPRLRLLPYWIHCDVYPVPVRAEKDIDVFFGARQNSGPRERVFPELRALARDGYRVHIQKERCQLPEYFDLLARSYLVLSPEGHGYQCFRHYEAMLAGSVPLINEATSPPLNGLLGGFNCLFYPDVDGGLAQTASAALSDRAALQARGRELPVWVVANHSTEAVGRFLMSELRRLTGEEVETESTGETAPHDRSQIGAI